MPAARLLVCLMLLPASLLAAEPPPPPDLARPPERVSPARLAALPPHPRLLATPARWEELRAQVKTDPASAEMLALLRARADAWLTAPPVHHAADSQIIVGAAREAQRRLLTLALVDRLAPERDPRHLAALRSVIAGLLAQPWPRGHFLGTAEATFALAIAYDWLHADLSPAEREAIAAKLRDEALIPTIEEEEKMGWLWADHNWNQVCHGGLVAAALVLADRDPVLSARVINRAVALLPRAAASYAPAGVYPEGPSYWGYGTTFHLIQIEAYRSALGSSLGLETFPGFLSSADYIDQLTGPSGEFFNHGDNYPKRGYSAAYLWLARETRRPDLALAELRRILRQAPANPRDDTRELPLALLWWSPPPGAPDAPSRPLAWRGEGAQPIASLRTAWDDPLATWLALKGGTANHSHAHMDSGGFVFEALGVRWAVDPTRDDYGFIRAGGYTQAELFNYAQDSRRWRLFRLGPEGHNIPRFDDQPQAVNGHATLGPLLTTPEGSSVQIDLTAAYAGQVASATRTATLRPDGVAILADAWTTLDRPARVSWQWITRAVVTREPGGLRLAQAGRVLHLRIHDFDTMVADIEPVSPMLDPRVERPAPDLTRIVLRLATPASTTAGLRVELRPGAATPGEAGQP